jgi:hypothetical protein
MIMFFSNPSPTHSAPSPLAGSLPYDRRHIAGQARGREFLHFFRSRGKAEFLQERRRRDISIRRRQPQQPKLGGC